MKIYNINFAGNRQNIGTNKFNSENKRDNKVSTPIRPNKQEFMPRHYYGLISPSLSFGSTGFENTLADFYRFPPDKYQIDAAKSIYNGENTIVSAPTGTGKTLIAEYAINKNLSEGKRTFYTTPLKALSNQKYFDFCNLYGAQNVGIMTGETKYNTNAPVVVMTTEIYRNMVVNQQNDNQQLKDVKSVIFDEFHYMDDPDRGSVWEESVIFTPDKVQIIPLSATIGNAEKINAWVNQIHNNKSNLIKVSPKERHVPLQYYVYSESLKNPITPLIDEKINTKKLQDQYNNHTLHKKALESLNAISKATNTDAMTFFRQQGKMVLSKQELVDTLIKTGKFKHDEALKLASPLVDKESNAINNQVLNAQYNDKGDDEEFDQCLHLIKTLKKQNMVPAIFFVLSKKKCEEFSDDFASSGTSLLNEDEKKQMNAILDEYEKNNDYLGLDYNREALLSGVATHHAGLLPSYKNLIEQLFQKKLVKVVFATETLAAGINMPAKTVVLTSLEKPTAQKDENGRTISRNFTPNEYHQMTGRAGRRGMDEIGNVIIMDNEFSNFEDAYNLTVSQPNDITSKWHPSYSFLTSYFEKNQTEDNLNKFIDKSFYNFEKNDNETAKIKNDINTYKNILAKTNFLEKTDHGYKTTEKGNFINGIRGCNELLLADLIYSGDLKALPPEDLAASISGLTYSNFNKNFAKNQQNTAHKTLYTEELSKNLGLLGLNSSVTNNENLSNEQINQIKSQLQNKEEELSHSQYSQKSDEELKDYKKHLSKVAKASNPQGSDIGNKGPKELLELLDDPNVIIDKEKLNEILNKTNKKIAQKHYSWEKLKATKEALAVEQSKLGAKKNAKKIGMLKSEINAIEPVLTLQSKLLERLDNIDETKEAELKNNFDEYNEEIKNITKYQSDKFYLTTAKSLLEKIEEKQNKNNNTVNDQVQLIAEKAKKFELLQLESGITPENAVIDYNTAIIPFIKDWAAGNKFANWNDFAQHTVYSSAVKNEGDLFKVMSSTLDLLKQIEAIADEQSYKVTDPNQKNDLILLSQNAKKAVELLKKPPIGDMPQELNIEGLKGNAS